ncbi:MAG: hypothetical protein WCR72_11185 [Bacteroidota bacterium]
MSNIFSQSTSPAFKRQAIDEYFIQPMFMAEDIRGLITVRTDIKGTETLNRVGRPSMLTKPKTTPGFTPAGGFNLTYTDITVKPMALEFEQNARAFWGSIVEQLLASGYKEDDVEQMKSPDVWNKVMLPLIAQAGQDDLIRQMFFSNPAAETLVSGIPNGVPDSNYTGYTGFMSWLFNDLYAGVIPSVQHVPIASAVASVKQEVIHTYTAGTDTALNITINGVLYTQPYATSAAATATAWLNTNKANVESRAGINGVIVTNPSAGAIKVTGKVKGQSFTSVATVTGTGTVANSGIVAAVKAGGLAANEADVTLESMLDSVTPEMHEYDLQFMLTASMWRNLVHTLKDRQTIMGDAVLKNGLKVPTYEGFPIIVRPDWDKWISVAQNGIKPHRAMLTTSKNLLFATDGTSDSEMIETWYNQEAQMRRYRVQYKAQTAYLHKELVVLAGFID